MGPRYLVAFIAILVVLAACGGGSDDEAPTATTVAPAAATATSTPTALPSSPTSAGATATIAREEGACQIIFAGDLASDATGQRIYCVDADGSGLHSLTNAPGQTLISDAYEAFPAWSPDGTQVAFTRTGPGGGIFIVNADGTAERRIVEGWARDVSWSPDGTQLVFAWLPEGWPPNPDNTIELVVVDVDGSNLQALNDFPELQGDAVTDIFPAWSPDGAWISFQHWTHAARAEEDVIELYVVSADGSTLQRIETGELEGGFGSWAPDGELLVISVGLLSDPNPPAIYTATLDDGQLERLALLNVPFLGGNLDLSPDGSQIALSSTSQDIHETIDEESPAIDLFAVEVDSGEARVISELTDVQEVDPVWSPDGLRLLYLASLPRGGGQITVINADGSNPVTIVEGLGIQAQIWSPPMWRPAVE